MPKDVTLRQYYHIYWQDINTILKHWAQRQATGKVPFAFKKVGKAKNNHSVEEGNADADLGMDGDAEGDLEHNNDSKDSEDEESQGDSSSSNGQSTSLLDAAAEDGQSDSSSVEQQPLPEKKVSNLGYFILALNLSVSRCKARLMKVNSHHQGYLALPMGAQHHRQPHLA